MDLLVQRGASGRVRGIAERKPKPLGGHAIAGWQSNFTQADYEAAIARTVEYILAGDIFQANITQMFSAAIPEGFDPLAFYRVLRLKNPATFAAFMDYGDIQIASSSPERLLSVSGGIVEARPIKGTRRRDADPARDASLIADLTSSRKDRAENVMIVDLLRNDLSRVSRPGSVKVPVLCGLESYANVHHLVSVIVSELKDHDGIGGLLGAAFPGGSITGAPKIRAMEIIAEIERAARGLLRVDRLYRLQRADRPQHRDPHGAVRAWRGAGAGRRRHHGAVQSGCGIRREPHQDPPHHGGVQP